MQEEYWNTFKESGKIEDYLYYKGMGICETVLNKYSDDTNHVSRTGEKAIESNNSNWNGCNDHTYWRI